MIIKKDGSLYSIEGLERVITLKHDENKNIYASVRTHFKNKIQLPLAVNATSYFRLETFKTTSVGTFGLRSPIDHIFWSSVLHADLHNYGKGWTLDFPSTCTFPVEVLGRSVRYPSEEQWRELESSFHFLWEEEWLWCIYVKNMVVSTKLKVIADDLNFVETMLKTLDFPSEMKEKARVIKKDVFSWGKLFHENNKIVGVSVRGWEEWPVHKIGCSFYHVKRTQEMRWEAGDYLNSKKYKKNLYLLFHTKLRGRIRKVILAQSLKDKWFILVSKDSYLPFPKRW